MRCECIDHKLTTRKAPCRPLLYIGIQDGITPLHCAARSGSLALVEALLRAGSDVKAANVVRFSFSVWAAFSLGTVHDRKGENDVRG